MPYGVRELGDCLTLTKRKDTSEYSLFSSNGGEPLISGGSLGVLWHLTSTDQPLAAADLSKRLWRGGGEGNLAVAIHKIRHAVKGFRKDVDVIITQRDAGGVTKYMCPLKCSNGDDVDELPKGFVSKKSPSISNHMSGGLSEIKPAGDQPNDPPVKHFHREVAAGTNSADAAVHAQPHVGDHAGKDLIHFEIPMGSHVIRFSGAAWMDEDRQARSTVGDGCVNTTSPQPNPAKTTASPHPMAGLFEQALSTGPVEVTGVWLADWAYQVAQSCGYEKYERFPILEKEWNMVHAALPLLVECCDSARLQSLCQSVKDFLDFSLRWSERVWLEQEAEKKAIQTGELGDAGWSAYRIGWIYFMRGDSASLLQCANRAKKYWEKAGKREKAFAIRLRGLWRELKKEYGLAIKEYRRSLRLLRTIDPESVDAGNLLNDVADVMRKSGSTVSAKREYENARRVFTKRKQGEGIAICAYKMALLALKKKDWPAAEKLAHKALLLAEETHRRQLIGKVCLCYAEAIVEQDRGPDGWQFARRAEEIFSNPRQPEDLRSARLLLKRCGSRMAGTRRRING
jgi:tetratricopeptide (TPR) repeat protein